MSLRSSWRVFPWEGTCYQLLGSLSEDSASYILDVATHGSCSGAARRPRTEKNKSLRGSATAEQRSQVRRARETLRVKGLKPTPGAIKLHLGDSAPSLDVCKEILKHCRKELRNVGRLFLHLIVIGVSVRGVLLALVRLWQALLYGAALGKNETFLEASFRRSLASRSLSGRIRSRVLRSFLQSTAKKQIPICS